MHAPQYIGRQAEYALSGATLGRSHDLPRGALRTDGDQGQRGSQGEPGKLVFLLALEACLYIGTSAHQTRHYGCYVNPFLAKFGP
jgi:hypothetical protein